MAAPATTRFGTILAVADVERSREFYERLGFAGEALEAPADRSRMNAVLVLEVEDCMSAFHDLRDQGVEFLADPYSPPWGGHRCFAADPDGYLVELEQPA